MEIKEISSLSLAFVGDAHFSLMVREYLVRKSNAKPQQLQRLSTHYVSAKAQAQLISYLLEQQLLSDEEIEIYKRGRNAKSGNVPKNTDVQTYHMSTGFEALWGYWYLTGQKERLTQIWDVIKTIVGE
ncbi:MAG: ribonuclease III domain-containing protein [Erysipelotrichaceae bacterium]|nr:ribonuclease III domain-containing protein [Erysipelotrichaceae bacterium]